jgi:hypothetical protein
MRKTNEGYVGVTTDLNPKIQIYAQDHSTGDKSVDKAAVVYRGDTALRRSLFFDSDIQQGVVIADTSSWG